MLKTLRVTSIITVILAAVGVIAIVVFGLKGDPEIAAFLEKESFVDKLRSESGQRETQKEKSSPLVDLAKLIAIRFDPPPPPPSKEKPKPSTEVVRKAPTSPEPVRPKVITVKSDLVATVLCKSAPGKSLALFQTGASQEWFRQGEKVGHLEIQEIRDGSVLFKEGNEVFVPAKPNVASFLKSDSTTSATPRTGPGSVTARLADTGQTQQSQPAAASAEKPAVGGRESEKVRMTRPVDRTPRTRQDAPTRITRTRSVPKPPTRQEQKDTLEETMTGIADIMNRQDDSISEEERQKENQMWRELLQILNAEKEQLDSPAEGEEPSKKDAEATTAEPSNETTEETTRDAAGSVPAKSK